MTSIMDIFGPSDEDQATLGDLARELTFITSEVSDLEKRKSQLKAEIMQLLDSMGMDSASAGGRRLGFTTRKYYGISEGESPDQREQNLKHMKEWLESVAPEVNVPASANIGKAVAAYLDENPSAEIPDFVKVTEQRSLTNRQA
jgi:hypothetical protein